MPNGGSDNCVFCGFNSANEGQWHQWQKPADETTPSSCIIRDGIPIARPFWTYCRNFASRSPEATGPIYASGLYETGYARIPWNGAFEPEIHVTAVCVVCGRQVEKGITVAVDRRTVVGACSNAHYLQWWMTAHPGDLLPPWGEYPWDEDPPDSVS
jgi:hypothetical protein